MYTEEQLRVTLKTLKQLKAENTDVDPTTYTVDHIVDMMIMYFDNQQYKTKSFSSPQESYDRAMKGLI